MSEIDVTIIEPPRGLIRLNIKEVYKYKDLLYIFIWRNLKVRYKQTVIGVAWVIFQPLFNMAIFTVVFSKVAKIPSESVPYPIFVFAGLLFWGYFNAALFGANSSLVEGQGILKKIYFPRLIVPLAATVTPIVDFVLVFLIFFGLMAYFKVSPHLYGVLIMPVLVFICFLSSTGLGLFLASLNVRYRDVQIFLGFFLQALFYATPIIYPISVIPASFRWLVYLNPVTGPIVVFRSIFLGTSTPDWRTLGISFAISLSLFILGLIYFGRSERYFADEL